MEYKILVADDSDIYLNVIKQIFNIVGDQYQLIFAKDGKAACDMAILELPDLILMDVIMPEINGIEATRILKNNEATKDIPIIVLAATVSLESAYEVGVNDFITKPFNQIELLIKVRSALSLVSKIKNIKQAQIDLELKHAEVIAQRDQIAMQRKDILDDIQYSKRIQNAILPTPEFISRIIPSHFILNLPRNIVSGDFYWVGEIGSNKIIACADCTGHGISGAFMTMAGIAFLNEIISKNDVLEANQILFELRELLMKLLQQKGAEGEASDGMDISLTIINENKRTIQFSGANNPLYIVNKEGLQIIKGDRMPIGIHLNFTRPFSNHEIPIEKGDMIYQFSDGFADQFGGPHNKKFRYKQFQDLILENHHKDLNEQLQVFSDAFFSWKGEAEQIDDVLILGYRY